ncbi:MAG: succinate dehydrogenase, cytochrome b556 subunit [Hyphomicrobiaceae bacterium]
MTLKTEARRATAYRRDRLWRAAMVHRISGLLLALFLPLHFLALGLAIEGAAQFDGFLAWTEQPLVKLAEAVLVLLLTVHLAGGVRLLAIENLAWRDNQKALASGAVVIAVTIAVAFLLIQLR